MLASDEEILQIKELLKAHPKGLTISEIAKVLSMSRVSAARYLDRLLYSGQAEMRKFGHANVYTIASRLPLSHILDLFSSPVAIVGTDLFIRDVNGMLLETFRLQREDLVGHHLQYTSLYPVFPETFLPLARSALNGTPGALEITAGLHGRTGVFNVKLEPVTDETGQECVAIILEDISLRKHYERDLEKMVSQRTTKLSKLINTLSADIENHKEAKEALKVSHQKYRSLAENIPALICCFEIDGTITFANENFCRFLDKEDKEIVGSSLFSLTIKDKLDILPETLKTLNSDHPSMTIVKSTNGPDGQLTWQQWTYSALFKKTGRVSEYQSVGIDITSLVRAEQALAEYEKTLNAIIRGSPLPQFVIDKNHMIVFWNTAMEKFTKIPANSMIGTKITGRFFYQTDHPLLADLIIDEKFDEMSKEYPGNCRKCPYLDETWEGIAFSKTLGDQGTWVYFTGAAIRDVNGNITHAVETLLDLMAYCTKYGRVFVLDPENVHNHDTADDCPLPLRFA
jgi:PAS domain S-box-containing protein